MTLALQIAAGIWFGGLLLTSTLVAVVTISNRIERGWRHGYAWWEGIAVSR